MSRHTPAQIHALATLSLGVVEAVEAGGEEGAPDGVLFAAMQAQGATYTQFAGLMDTLVRPGYLRLEHEFYQSTETTQKLKTKLTKTLAAFAS
jgi:hypothetical protein